MIGKPVVALFCGSRKWTDRARVRRDLESLPEGSIVIEGGAPGADRIAREEAKALGLHVATVCALWDYYDKGSAGCIRNEAMARLEPDYVYAYPLDGPGTRHMIRIAEENCIQVREA
jgi:hypothetical protein